MKNLKKPICLIGDPHAMVDRVIQIVKTNDPVKSVILGDVGFGFRGINEHTLIRNALHLRGNHDSPGLARKHPNYLGDYGFNEEYGFFFVSGADSVWWDKQNRTPGYDWWPDEQLSIEDCEKCLELYAQVKPDVVITHDGPKEAVMGMGICPGPYYPSRMSNLYEEMLRVHRPLRYYFGHWHVDAEVTIDGTYFRCVDELSSVLVEP